MKKKQELIMIKKRKEKQNSVINLIAEQCMDVLNMRYLKNVSFTSKKKMNTTRSFCVR